MNILKNWKTNGILRTINSVAIIVIYKTWGIDWVVIYGLINIDAHIDDISNKLDTIIRKRGGNNYDSTQ